MRTRTPGRGLGVSAIGLGRVGVSQGCGPNAGGRQEMIQVPRGAVERGVTFSGTAGVRLHRGRAGRAGGTWRERAVARTNRQAAGASGTG